LAIFFILTLEKMLKHGKLCASFRPFEPEAS